MSVPTRMTPLQQDVLAAVGELGPASVGDVATLLRRPKASVRGAIKRLEAKALAEHDRANATWHLTVEGHKLDDSIWEGHK